MSIIFGIRRPQERTATHQEMHILASATQRYAPDGTFLKTYGAIGMGFQPYHTHLRSRLEQQPVLDSFGNMLVLDGRLDNWEDLRRKLDIGNHAVTDSTIVLEAFFRWQEDCFSHFIGDWALALWAASEHVLYLARDHAGTRTLYFHYAGETVTWSTYLETLVDPGKQPNLDEDYIACYLGSQPIRDLTPYRDVRAVPPAHYIVFRGGTLTRAKHWEWMGKKQLRYKTDAAYDEHFLSLFQQAVGRRAEPDTPVVAELSGGMDSSSIVCMSDYCRSLCGSTDLVDTISYYRDCEPNWDELPYFSLVEAKRGRTGTHIDVSLSEPTFRLSPSESGSYLFPANPHTAIEMERKFQSAMISRQFRAVLSGIGGDELLGGVPTLLPELAEHLVSGNFNRLLKHALQSCLASRTSFIRLLAETASFTFRLYYEQPLKKQDLPRWLSPRLYDCCSARQRQDVTKVNRFGLSPNTICCGLAWWSILETFPHLHPMYLSRYEFRYPYLDRDLVEYLHQIPRGQLVRPGRRRQLMRRALRQIVPTEILERRRKAFVVRDPLLLIQREHAGIRTLLDTGWLASNGYIDQCATSVAIDRIITGADFTLWPGVLKAATFELWLRSLGEAYQECQALQPQ